jgi:flagellar hook-basal body complex protein FliE
MVIPPLSSITPIQSPLAPSPATGATGASGSNFANLMSQGLQSVSASENNADSMLQTMASGGNVNPADVMIATSEASLSVQMLTSIRDQAVNAYKDIMNMNV